MQRVPRNGSAWPTLLAIAVACTASQCSSGGDAVDETDLGSAGSSAGGTSNAIGGAGGGGSPTPGGSNSVGGAMNTGDTGWTISSNKKYLVDQQGNPFLLQGEAAWEIIQGLSEAEAIAYLDDRKSRGVNALIVELIEHKFTAHTPRSANVAGHVPFANNNDFTTTHDDYFNDAERFIEQALSRGFLLFMTPSYIGYGCGDEGWCAEMKANGVAKLTQYGRYVGQKFRNYPNIVWVEGGDHTPSTAGNPSEMDLVNAVANGVIAGDGGTHLHTAHWKNGTSSADVPNLAWLSLDAMYWNAGLHLYTKTLADWTRDKGIRPSFLIETWYENEHQVSRIQLRAQMYQPLLSGSTGFFVGNDPIWFFGNTGDSNPGWTFGDGVYPAGWKSALDSPGARDAARAGRIFRSIAWETLVPDVAHSIVTAGGTDGSDRCALLASNANNSLAVAYFTANVSATLDMSKFPAPMKASWLDPTSETTTPIAGGPFANTGSKVFTPPGNNSSGAADWVLLLQ